jgi:hypothetical protein
MLSSFAQSGERNSGVACQARPTSALVQNTAKHRFDNYFKAQFSARFAGQTFAGAET